MVTQKRPSDIFTDLDDFLETSRKKADMIGSWGFDSNINFTKMSKEETNVWFFEQVFNFLRSFFGLVMPDSLEVITYNAKKQVNKENLDQMTFLDELMLVLKKLEDPIWVVKIGLSVVGFLRSEWSPDKRIRLRIQEPTTFIVWGGPDEHGSQSFSISYKLFSSQKIESKGIALWSMNQPLLEKGLRKWEKQTGRKINIVKGNHEDLNLYQHGFKGPAPQDLGKKEATPPPPPPKEDYIPDLSDFEF